MDVSMRSWPQPLLTSTLVVAVALMSGVVRPVSGQTETGTRAIEFTTDEGTWVSLDLSPDGQTILFELLGDVYRLPREGGAAEPVLVGAAFESQPRFSADGAWIAYVSDRSGSDNVWIAASDGSDARMVSELPRAQVLSPAWSPDGQAVYATVIDQNRPGAAEIWEFFVDGSDSRRVIENANGRPAPLVSAPAPGAYGAAPAPDGSLYFTSVTPRPYGSRQGASSAVMVADPESGAGSRVTLGSTAAMKPMVSPDGSFLVYAAEARGQTGLKVRELVTGDERWLAYPIQRHQLESRATRDVLPNFAISGDSRFVLAAFGGKIREIEVASGESRVVPFSADVRLEVRERLAFPRAVPTGPIAPRRFQTVTASPDGRAAFATTGRIFTWSDRDGAARLTTTERPREYMPSWSPDGRWVAFVTWESDGGHLWRAAADGTEVPERVSDRPAMWLDPVWTPDSGAIVALRAPLSSVRTSGGRIPDDVHAVVVPLNGDAPRVLGSAAGLRSPHFAEAPARVFLGGARELVSIDLADGARRVEVALPEGDRPGGGFGPPQAPRWLRSPDGQFIALQRGGGPVTLHPVPAAAGATLDPDNAETIAGSEGATGFDWIGGDAPTDQVVWMANGALHMGGPGATTEHPLELAIPRAVPEGTIVLRGGTAITMRGDEVLPEADIVVTDNRIAAIAPAGTAAPEGAWVIDISGSYVVPGFIDIHAHFPAPGEMYEPDDPATLANLAFGITSVRNPQVGPDVFALADMVAADGLPAPRIFATGPGIFSFTNVRSLDHARELLRRYRDEYGTHMLKSYMPGNRQQRQWIAEASRELGMMPTTEGGADTKANLTHAIDGFSGNEHALPVAPFYDDVVQLLARSGITYTPTLVVSFGGALPVFRLLAEERPHQNVRLSTWFDEEELFARTSSRLLWFPPEAYNDRDAAASSRDVLAAGGRVALGGHGEVQGLSNHWEMELLASGGMRPHDVLRAATIHGAEAIGYADDLGSIEAGKLADLVILDRNPLEDITATTSIRHVMKDGALYTADLARVWPTAEPTPAPWRADRSGATREVRLDELVRRHMRDGRIPGAAVAVIENGEPTLVRGYGVANLEHEVAVSEATMFQSGSLGKQFTAAGVMALVEDGVLDLDESVRVHLTETPETWAPITLRHLLTHSSGIPDYTSDRFDYTRNYSERDLVRLASELELEFAAGTRWNYSNTGYVMLGVIMSRATGMPYYDFLRERIFAPAGMPTARVNTEAAIVRHRARGYLPTADGWQHAAWVAPELNTTADGSMLLSLQDMLAWHEAVRTRSVLTPNSWETILAPMTLNSGASYPYGFAWFVDEVGVHRVLQHSGAWQGFTTQYSYYPDLDLGIVVLANARSLSTGAIAAAVAATIEPGLTQPAPATTPTDDPSPETTAYVAAMLARAGAGELELTDFAFVRQTLFPRIRAGLEAELRGLGAPDRMQLLSREVVGDDTILEYFAWFGERRFRVSAGVGPEGGLTALRAREASE